MSTSDFHYLWRDDDTLRSMNVERGRREAMDLKVFVDNSGLGGNPLSEFSDSSRCHCGTQRLQIEILCLLSYNITSIPRAI